jgi:hypothetical protein
MKSAPIWLTATLFLASCAKINDTAMNLMSSSSPAVAVVGGNLLTGTAVLFTDRTGTLDLESGAEPRVKCLGTLSFTATRTGLAKLKCSDGAEALMYFSVVGETKGYGVGDAAKGAASFTFGFEPSEAAAYLTPPPGKRIVTSPDGSARLEPL